MNKNRKPKSVDTKKGSPHQRTDRSSESWSRNRKSSDTDSSRSVRALPKESKRKKTSVVSPARAKKAYETTKDKGSKVKVSLKPVPKKDRNQGASCSSSGKKSAPEKSKDKESETEKDREKERRGREKARNRDLVVTAALVTAKGSKSEEQESFESSVLSAQPAPVTLSKANKVRKETGRSLIGLDGESDLDTDRGKGSGGNGKNKNDKNGRQKIKSPQQDSPERSSSETKESVSLADDQEGRDAYKKVFKEFAMLSQKQTFDSAKEEYSSLPDKPTADKCAAYYSPANESKNRYSNIPCLEVSRIKLHFGNSRKDGDYIHANYVTSPSLATKYILTQAPKKNTRADFWRMVWQEQSTTIVMLCQFVEQQREKCSEYFPVTNSNPFVFVDVGIKLTYEDSTINKSVVTTKLRLEHNEESRIITHFQWMEWPDYQVPGSSDTMLRLLRKIRGKKTPPVIHCAAGVGRSGTLMAVEIALMKINNHFEIPDIKTIVSDMRVNGRCLAVQTLQQYMLIRKVVLDFGVSNRLITEESFNRYSAIYRKSLRNETFT